MRSSPRSGRRALPLAATALMMTFFTACDLLSEPKERTRAEEATVEVTGESPVPLRLVASKVWSIGFDEEVGNQAIRLTEADSTEIELPYERTVPLAPTYRILFRVTNPSEEHEANVRMRVFLDDDLVYDQQATLKNASLQFSHLYQ